MRSNKLIYLLLLLIAGIAFFAISDSLGLFSNKPYKAIPHGTHNHYVPHDRDPDVPIGDFPTQPPSKGERITPQGKVVPKSDARSSQK